MTTHGANNLKILIKGFTNVIMITVEDINSLTIWRNSKSSQKANNPKEHFTHHNAESCGQVVYYVNDSTRR
jgi:hypothetical protein